MEQFTQCAANNSTQVMVWSLINPENVNKVEKALAEGGGAVTKINFVYGVQGLYEYLSNLL
ncbi:MAG: hypothetical protein JWN25_3180 [Verrucomicrobiales bacterium]|nr:hypothetical protein [Verrucomicrobiales bacterium]